MRTYKPYEPTLLSKNLRSFKSFIKESTEPQQAVNPQVVNEGLLKRRINNEKGDRS